MKQTPLEDSVVVKGEQSVGCDGTVCVSVTSRLTGHITLTCTSLPVYKCMHFTRSVMLQQRCVVYIKHRTNYRMKFDEKKEALNNTRLAVGPQMKRLRSQLTI